MKYRNIFALLSFITIFLLACQDEIPVNELAKTRLAIDRAFAVKADEYAPEEYSEALKQLSVAHEKLIMDEDPGECIKSSDIAYNKAVEAYNKAVVIYSQGILKMAEEAVASADAVYAEKFSPDKFREAKDLYNSATQKYESKDYDETIAIANAAYEKAVKAREEAIDNKYRLQAVIDEAASKISRIEQYDYEAYASEQHRLAVENTRKAQDEYDNNRIKEGFGSAEIANKNADDALRLTLEGVTGAKLADAEEAVNGAENSSGASVAAEELAAAKEALANARQTKDQGYYDDSIRYCNEAIRLSNNVIEAGKKAEEEAIARVKSEEEAVNKDKDASKDTIVTNETTTDASKDKTADSGEVKEDDDYYYYKVKTWEKYKDCLWRIAGEYYDNPRLWNKIYKANKNKIKNPDIIRPGWIIRVPKLKK